MKNDMRGAQKKNARQIDLQSALIDLEALIKDERSLEELTSKLNEFNIFDVLKSAHHEIRHSNVLAWLLNPCESHMAGRKFFDAFVRKLSESSTDSRFLVSTYLHDDVEIRVSTEVMGIDILVEVPSAKFVIALENKVWSKEHDSQLPRYRKTMESIYKDEDGWQRFYFYMTPDGDSSTDDPEHWNPVSYQAVIEAVKETMTSMNSSNPAKLLVQHYCVTLERKIMKQSDIEELCKKIHRRHSKALNLIYEVVGHGGSPIQALLENALQKMESEEKLVICKERGSYIKPAFHTKALDEYFGRKQDDKGSWCNDFLYVFWFERKDESRLKMYFEVGPLHVTDSEAAKISAMAKAVGFKRKMSERWCRIWQYGQTFNALDNSDAGKLSSWVKNGVDEVLRLEKDWIVAAKRELGNKQTSEGAGQ